jgi:hypothetical protein
MRYRFYITTFILLATVLQAAAQALTDRYNKKRPVVVACDCSCPPFMYRDYKGQPAGSYIDIAKTLATQLGVPCEFVVKDWTTVREAFERGNADLIMADRRSYNTPYFISKNAINYYRVSGDSIAEIHFIGKDHQLINQLDDQFTRLKEKGDIAAIQDHWMHPELVEPEAEPLALYATQALLFLTVILGLLCILVLRHIGKNTRNSEELKEMISRSQQIIKNYAIEDNQAARDLVHKYNAILCNPYVAISFYDNNNRLIVENDAMKQLGHTIVPPHRRPLYNAKGEITNYFVAISCPAATT